MKSSISTPLKLYIINLFFKFKNKFTANKLLELNLVILIDLQKILHVIY